MRPITIQRVREYEINQAIQDLTDRGFTLLYGPVMRSRDGKIFSRDDYGRKIFRENTQHSIWVARLQKVEE